MDTGGQRRTDTILGRAYDRFVGNNGGAYGPAVSLVGRDCETGGVQETAEFEKRKTVEEDACSVKIDMQWWRRDAASSSSTSPPIARRGPLSKLEQSPRLPPQVIRHDAFCWWNQGPGSP